MPTIIQLIFHGKKSKQRTQHIRALTQCPQKYGICLHISTITPKKPNLALHKITKVDLTNQNEIIAYILGR
jgi:small subunit ribosomal protein S12